MAITISGSGIVEANLADNAVTLAKMASGTDGQVLTSTGAGSPPAFETAAAGGISDLSPYWYAYSSAVQSVGDYTYTKITCNTESLDSDSAYDNSTNYRFTVPSGKAGKYYVSAGIRFHTPSTANIRTSFCMIYKNGSIVNDLDWTGGAGLNYDNVRIVNISMILDLAVGDYIELFGALDNNANSGSQTMRGYISGHKIG